MDNKSGSIKIIIIVIVTAIITSGLTFVTAKRMYNPTDDYVLYFDKGQIQQTDIQKFNDVWKLLEDNYLYEIDEREMFEGAIAGLPAGLDEPYTVYYNQDEMKKLNEYSSSSYVGVGLIVSENTDGLLEVIEPVENGPAHGAGMKKGDLIIRVDEEDITMEDSDLVIGKIKGEEGTLVKITAYRPDELRYMDFTIERKKVHLPSVASDILQDNIGYIRLSMFDTQVASDFYNELNGLLKKGIVGLVLDLRDNPGGSYDQVVDIADMLLPEADILYTEDKHGNRQYEKSGPSYINIPLVVLVNNNSASASEVLAGALQDNDRAKILGTQTYGKGVVQVIIPLRDGSGLKVTISGYYTPNGHSVQGIGITPNRVVEASEEYKNSSVSGIPRDKDIQLHSAIEVLKGLIAE